MVPLDSILDDRRKPMRDRVALLLIVIVPFVAVLLAIPAAWREGGVPWDVVIMGVVFYVVSMLGITVGFHRYFTHRSFRAGRLLRIALALAGSLAIQGPVLHWVADHRRHHAFADRDGDPHSPWRYGTGLRALAKGMAFAHVGWLFNVKESNQDIFAPDLKRDADIRLISRFFALIAVVSLALPPLIEVMARGSWRHVLEAFILASLVRVFLVHHVTWSVNSVCHVFGSRSFDTRDRSTNFWPLAILSMGEAWHNAHHAVPACARHGVEKGQIDPSAWLIGLFERMGWATSVKWPEMFGHRELRMGAGQRSGIFDAVAR